jgi:hypothetical protein
MPFGSWILKLGVQCLCPPQIPDRPLTSRQSTQVFGKEPNGSANGGVVETENAAPQCGIGPGHARGIAETAGGQLF